MSRIRILPEAVANRIAAGEVVERPASVVKEVLENAIDAGATIIRIECESGGKRLIRVADNGCGMNHDDALLAFERHATSKLRNLDDLMEIDTLGFRGEALPSIASVSRLVLETCSSEGRGAGGEALEKASGETHSTERSAEKSGPSPQPLTPSPSSSEGTRVEFAAGKLINVRPAGLPPGTTITVSDLFYSVPARRKFLKSETTELGHIASLVTHYALAHPDKQFELRTPSQVIVDAPPVATLAERVYQLFGRAALDELIELPAATAPFRAALTELEIAPEEAAATLTVRGFASRPEVQRANRNGIYIFVNGRLIRDRLILHAIHEAYRNLMPGGVFPAVLLFLEMPCAEVDVNVHPAKVEVRFRHANFVHDFTRDAIRAALSQARPIASFAGATAPAGVPAGPSETYSPVARSEAAPGGFTSVGQAGTGAAPARAVIPPMAEFALTEAPQQPEGQRFAFPAPTLPAGAALASLGGSYGAQHPGAGAAPAPAESLPLSQGASAVNLATLKPLGQVNNSFIVAINGEGLWIIDQHVAHERILFEQHLRARRAGGVTGQRLLDPLLLDLLPQQMVTLTAIAEELSANGFEVNAMGGRSVAVQATPGGIGAAEAEQLLRQILEGVEREVAGTSLDTLQARIAATTSCHAAIKVNTPLDLSKMEWLLAELAKTECPMSCPHGRPVVLRYSLREIEKAFKRI
jgi:DNA mismatch repair protein MutL